MKKKNDLLLVIDMQNVYMPGREWECPSMPGAIKNIRTLLDADVVERAVFTKFTAPLNPRGAWKQYNQEYAGINENSYLNEIVGELKPYLSRWPLYEKSVYSSFKVRELEEAARDAEQVLLCGVVAECCVLATLMEAIDLGHKVIYLSDCIAGQSRQKEEDILEIARSFSTTHTLVMESGEYLASVKPK